MTAHAQAYCSMVNVTPTDAGLIGFIFGVAFASVFFFCAFARFCNPRQ